jgi:hypothetical protein
MKKAIGEIVDRYTICKLKSERTNIDNSKEIDSLLDEIKKYKGIELYVDALYKLNGDVWDIEGDIRCGNENILGLEEVGRRALQLRKMNIRRVDIKNQINLRYNEGYVDIKVNHGSETIPSIVITLTTVPERLADTAETGIISVIESLCVQDDNDYEIHFNIPEVNVITKKPYIIPDWLYEYKLKYPHLKIFRTEDYGPPTKFVPTLERVLPLTILLVVDDDLTYHPKMVSEHRKYQGNLHTPGVICYEGRGAEIALYDPIAGDMRDNWILCVTQIREVHSLMHYKSVSYRKFLFDDDFYKYYLGRTFSDDALVSKYFRDKRIRMYVVPYEPENHLFTTKELWDTNAGVTTFPVIRHSTSVSDTGCHNPALLKHPLGDRFFEPPTLGDRSYIGPTIV